MFLLHSRGPVVTGILLALAFLVARELSAQDLSEQEEQAIRAAVAVAAPSVVRIETVGGREKVGKMLVGTGPTTGLIVSDDGYVVSSAYNFIQQPSSILVTLPGGKRAAAKIVARDHARMLVLLKVNTQEKLPLPTPVPRDELAVGQWTIALGRTFEGDAPSLSVGVLSATNRIWGRAVQTDCKVSPINYGGPLIDIRGRVIGILVPLSPQGQESEVAGTEWYDSGIGFAVPLAELLPRLETLKSGRDLHPGLLGISLKRGDIYSLPAEVAACRADGPAGKAGLKAGDEIVDVAGQAIVRQAQLKHALGALYAGDKVQVTVRRGTERIESTIELIDKLDPYQHLFLGILPIRDDKQPGVLVRYVYPGSPAEKAGVQVGDRIIKLAGAAVASPVTFQDQFAVLGKINKVALEIQRGAMAISLDLVPTALPTTIPADLPPALSGKPAPPAEKPVTGLIEIKLAEEKNQCLAYVPDSYHPDVPHGVVIWLHGSGGVDKAALQARWQAACNKHQLIVLAPQALDPSKWQPTEAAFVRKTLDDLMSHYAIDRSRIAVYGYQTAGSLAFMVGVQNTDRVRAIVAIDALPPARLALPDNDPLVRLAFFLGSAEKSPAAAVLKQASTRLQEAQFPVTNHSVGDQPRDLNDVELLDLARWLDALDRI